MNDPIDLVSDPDANEHSERQDQELDSSEKNVVDEMEQLRIELDQAKDRGLRALADLENYRVRVQRQATEERKYANIDLMRDMLAVWDNIGRALEAVDKTHNLESLVEGINLVHQQFLDALNKFHCIPIKAIHTTFDPNYHQSIALIPNEEYPVNTIIEEVQPGFQLHERVVRPSQVVLSSGKNVEA